MSDARDTDFGSVLADLWSAAIVLSYIDKCTPIYALAKALELDVDVMKEVAAKLREESHNAKGVPDATPSGEKEKSLDTP